ncbi:hypothetical protein QBC43DRAFT_306887 [Cladorrhinum sp. PSN259]|nr:hypothetical protein QBC43DRAFT_306887 [Cladorrhinum sp. PSN259]
MPPFISILDTRDEYSLSRYNEEASTSGNTSNNSTVWIISSIVGGVLVLVAILTTFLLCFNKRSQYQKAKELNPYLSRQEFVRRRKMSAEDLFQEEEQRRQLMIRKSVVSRSSQSLHRDSPPRQQQPPPRPPRPERWETLEQVEREAVELERQESLKLKDDWKRWEARVKHERSTSGEHHPLETSGVPILTMPSPSRHRSESRVFFIDVSPSVLVPPPRHPDRPYTNMAVSPG